MKGLVLAIVLAICGDAAFNQHRYTTAFFDSVSSLIRSSSEEIGGSVFRS